MATVSNRDSFKEKFNIFFASNLIPEVEDNFYDRIHKKIEDYQVIPTTDARSEIIKLISSNFNLSINDASIRLDEFMQHEKLMPDEKRIEAYQQYVQDVETRLDVPKRELSVDSDDISEKTDEIDEKEVIDVEWEEVEPEESYRTTDQKFEEAKKSSHTNMQYEKAKPQRARHRAEQEKIIDTKEILNSVTSNLKRNVEMDFAMFDMSVKTIKALYQKTNATYKNIQLENISDEEKKVKGLYTTAGFLAATGGIIVLNGVILNAKSSIDVGILAAKGLRGATRTAIKAKERHDRIVAGKNIDYGREATQQLIELLEGDIKEQTVPDEILQGKDKDELNRIRSGDRSDIDAFQAELDDRSDSEIKTMSNLLTNMKNVKVYNEIIQAGKDSGEFDFDPKEVGEFLSKVKVMPVNGKQEIVIPEGSNITKEFLDKNSELKDKIINLAQIPRVQDLSEEQIEILAKNINVENGEISFSLDEIDDPVLKSFAEGMSGKDLYTPAVDKFQSRLTEVATEHEVTDKILTEVELRNKLEVAHNLNAQFNIMDHMLDRYYERANDNGEFSFDDKKQISKLAVIAAKKVKSMQKHGIASVCQKGQEAYMKVMAETGKELSLDDLVTATNVKSQDFKIARHEFWRQEEEFENLDGQTESQDER